MDSLTLRDCLAMYKDAEQAAIAADSDGRNRFNLTNRLLRIPPTTLRSAVPHGF